MNLISVVLLLAVVVGPSTKTSAAGWEGTHRVWTVTADGELILEDGVRVCLVELSAVQVSKRESGSLSLKAAITGLIGDDQVEIVPDPVIPYDRYGCLRARVRTTAGQWLGRSIVEQGLALVRPAPGSNGAIDDLLMLEDEARSAARGLWQAVDARPKSADALDHRIGTNEIVEGRVTRVSSNDRYVYLNFGADWRTDFTIRLDQRMVAAEELDVRRFEGKKLRVRGFIQEARGPLIDIVNPKQIEVLP